MQRCHDQILVIMKIIKKNYNSNLQRYTEILCTTLLQNLNFWKSWIVLYAKNSLLYAIFLYENILLLIRWFTGSPGVCQSILRKYFKPIYIELYNHETHIVLMFGVLYTVNFKNLVLNHVTYHFCT